MTYQVDTDAPPRYQFESSSGTLTASQVYNCGPACVTGIAQFYRDTWFGIETNRGLIRGMGPYNVNGQIVYGAPASMPTNAWQQRDMLRKRGVSCEVYGIGSVEHLHALVDGGRRPVLLGLNFARVLDSVAGHSFNGWHAIRVRTGTWVNGVRGFLVNDPNFTPLSGTTRSDPTRGKRFYSDTQMGIALDDPEVNWAVVPTEPKAISKPIDPIPTVKFSEAQEMAILANITSAPGRTFDVRAGVELRKGPGVGYPLHYVTSQPEQFWLHGFVGGTGGWVAASRSSTSTGLFFVPPAH